MRRFLRYDAIARAASYNSAAPPMSLAAGVRLGPYEVTSQIGAGGMGEVWRATDTHLGRQVAIKVLPDVFAQDPERLARFEREARTLAALNHPNIATIHGLEKSQGTLALVMELVEGPTLAEIVEGSRLRAHGSGPDRAPSPKSPASATGSGWAGHAPSLTESLHIGRQVAEALEAAHEQGIVHRDLKPANVKVRPDGTVKVLDFGLAKALGAEPSSAAAGDVTNSPTLTSPAMTAIGMILGTAAYMAPEQARGKPVDKRADIWAFGCVLFEMLTGRKAFEGDDVSLTLSKILQRDPDWALLPAGTPAAVRRLLERCLDKDPKRRLRDIGEARLALEHPVDTREPEPASAVPQLQFWQRPIVAAVAALAMVAATAAAVWFSVREPSSAASTDGTTVTRHLNVVLPDDAPLVFIGEMPGGVGMTALALSHDGRWLAYVGRAGNTTRISVPDMNDPVVRPLAGTEGAYALFFSSDSQWIGFFSGRRLMRASVDGRQVSPIAEANWSYGGSWSDDNRIVMVTNDGVKLSVVESQSGRVTSVAGLGTDPRMASPFWLPGSDWILLTCYEPQHICAVSVRTGERRHLVLNDRAASTYEGVALLTGSNPRYIQPGFLVYSAARDNVVMAARFDPTTLTVLGEPVALLRGVRREILAGVIQLSASDNGDAVFAAGSNAVTARSSCRRMAAGSSSSPTRMPDRRRSGSSMR